MVDFLFIVTDKEGQLGLFIISLPQKSMNPQMIKKRNNKKVVVF